MPDQGLDLAIAKAPGVIGAPAVQAYDLAMDAAAHNAGLTNVVDKPRYGESSVPRLPPHQQKLVDGFWGSPAKKTVTKRVDLSGLYGDRATAAQAASPVPGGQLLSAFQSPLPSQIVNQPGARPPVRFVAGDGVAKDG